jgi:hypothetical protein
MRFTRVKCGDERWCRETWRQGESARERRVLAERIWLLFPTPVESKSHRSLG